MRKAFICLCALVIPLTAMSEPANDQRINYQFEPSARAPYGEINSKAPDQLKDFVPMIGESNCQSMSRNSDGSWDEAQNMLWRFKYIMNGMAIQDETLKADGKHSGSIRQFILDENAWFVHYYSTGKPTKELPAWKGNKNKDGDIVLLRDQKSGSGLDGKSRLTFYNIKETGFDWVGEWVSDDQKVVYPFWKITCKKK